MSRRPDFIIIGAMKSATTTLHVQLGRQDGFHMSRPKEPNFFSDDDCFAKGLDWYESLFADTPADALCGESSTHYTKLPTYPHTLDRLAEHVPDARFVYVMRDPIERLVSQYVHEWTRGDLNASIDEAVRSRTELIDYGRYAMQLEPYLQRFGGERVLPVFFERLRDHPQEQLERVCDFLGYEGSPRWEDADSRKNASARRERPSRVRTVLERTPGVPRLVRTLLSPSVRERIRTRLWRLPRRPVLSAGSERYVRELIDEDLARLGGWLGVEMTSSNFGAVVDRPSLQWQALPMESPCAMHAR